MKTNLFSREYLSIFGENLKIKIDAWQNNPKNKDKYTDGKRKVSLERFAEEVSNIATKGERGPDRQQIGKYMKGKVMPTENVFDALCSVLECRDSDLLPYDHKNKYRYSFKYMNDAVNKKAQYAEKIGIREDFLSWLSELPQYRTQFPLYRPIKSNNTDIFNPEAPPRIRMEPAKAASVDSPFQVEFDGYDVLLHDTDIRFIKELQDETFAFVIQRLKEKQAQYDKEYKDAIEEAKTEDGWTLF